MRRIVIFLGIWMVAGSAFAQQSAQYTQYIFNGLVINPAYAGSKEMWNLSAIYRDQWAGLEGAPTTQTFSVDGTVKKNKIGLGLQAINDRLGAQGQLSVLASAAIRMPLSGKSKLSFGLAGGATQHSLDGTALKATASNDPDIPNSKITEIVPSVKAGFYFHTDRLYVGLSGADLVPVKNEFVLTPERHYFLTSGYVFDLGEHVKFKPSFLLKEDFNGPTNLDLNAFVLFAERIWIGSSYRTGVNLFKKTGAAKNVDLANAWAGIAEVYLTPKIKLGYSYDVTLTGLSSYPSHEFSLGYYILKKEGTSLLSPRYF
ncbi:PorP/SprF family type IX secretion system membrane protein [Adhaeribacter soli]|uniref:Type IX secretion system membrane protein PorP/SprF n=1 Tax=Adhaeribacter soli TaxID=2607655 RepID=A0A5N1J278_9BACT|nr:type IX secretion system membrane protein PorP/SprF [Adhaeribacter soli]KAA9340157.1 type IX secretion system membrane protein PorP/SprF [Adhaeribacter soli]